MACLSLLLQGGSSLVTLVNCSRTLAQCVSGPHPELAFRGCTSLAAWQGAGAFSPDKYGWCPVGHSVQRLGWV